MREKTEDSLWISDYSIFYLQGRERRYPAGSSIGQRARLIPTEEGAWPVLNTEVGYAAGFAICLCACLQQAGPCPHTGGSGHVGFIS